MTQPESTPVTDETPAPGEGEAAPETEAQPEGSEEQAAADAASETAKEELAPEVLREQLTRANAEAANYRVKLRNAEKALEDAESVEEYKAAVENLKEVNATLERQILVTSVATEHKLPAELAELLQGEDEAALKAHAAKLAKFVPAEEPTPTPGGKQHVVDDLTGGLNPGGNEDTFDAVAVGKALARKNRRR
jgi:hypothetical protein